MMQNSLDRLFAGMAASLHDVVLPEVEDDFSRSQLLACIELLANLSTRVQWRSDQIEATTSRAREAINAAVVIEPALADFPENWAGGGPVAERDKALALVSWALRRCDELDLGAEARAPLLNFAQWHLQSELELLRTGMFSK